MAEVGTAWVSVVPSAKGFGKDLDRQVGGEVEKTGKSVGKRFGTAIKGGALALAGGAAALTGFLKGSLDEAREAQKVGGLTNAVIKSTGGAAKVTAKQVGDLAGALSSKTGIDDEVIQSGQNMLLTFKNIRNETGKGNKIFDQATSVLVDMSSAMGTEPKQAAIQLGKALNDPIKGTAALGRVGVQFTDQQKKTIASLVESGDTMKAQKIILGELRGQFGGAAEAQATASDKMQVAWGNLQETVGTALIPVVDRAANLFTNKVAPAVERFVGEMQSGTGAGGAFVAKLRALYSVGENVVGAFMKLPGPVRSFGVQMGITLLVMGRLRALFSPVSAAIGTFVTNVRSAETRMAGLRTASQNVGAGLRNIAGAGGLMMVADSANRTSRAMGGIQGAVGGAIGGASLGAFAGPPGALIGAAIGGLAGGLFGLGNSAKGAGTKAAVSVSSWQNLAGTLDEVSGKATQATRQLVMNDLRKSGVLSTLTRYGINARQAVNAITSGGPAQARFVATLNREKQALQDTAAANRRRHQVFLNTELDPARRKAGIESYNQSVKNNRAEQSRIGTALRLAGATARAVQRKREEIAATREFSGAINKLPKNVQVHLRQKGLLPTRKGIVDLTRKFNLMPKDIRVLIKENGGTPTKKMVEGIRKEARGLGREKVNTKVGETGSRNVRRLLVQTTEKAKEVGRQKPNIRVSADTSGARRDLDAIVAAGNRRTITIRARVANPPGRAAGGPVESGQTYWVGERGPELFTASQSGRIIPNHQLPAGSGGLGGGGPLILRIGDREFRAYTEEIADGRVLAQSALASQAGRF